MDNEMNASEFIFYRGEDGKMTVHVIVGDETVWLTQRGLSETFGVTAPTINEHLQNIFKTGELDENSVIRKIRITANDGKTYLTNFYSLDVIIAVGYRVNSYKATQFRIWATRILKEYMIKGFVLDDERLKQGNKLFGKDYFKELLERIKEIRASERLFYEKITDLYATSADYDKNSPETFKFFAKVQNKLEFAIVAMTSGEIIKSRADSSKEHMGLTTWKNAGKEGKIQKSDVVVAKNYLNEDEIKRLNSLVNMYLEYAENLVARHRLMKMEDWASRLDAFLKFNEFDIIDNAGKVTKAGADLFAETEFAKFRVIQDREYKSDFNKVLQDIKGTNKIPSEKDIFENPKEAPEIISQFDQNLKVLLSAPPPPKGK